MFQSRPLWEKWPGQMQQQLFLRTRGKGKAAGKGAGKGQVEEEEEVQGQEQVPVAWVQSLCTRGERRLQTTFPWNLLQAGDPCTCCEDFEAKTKNQMYLEAKTKKQMFMQKQQEQLLHKQMFMQKQLLHMQNQMFMQKQQEQEQRQKQPEQEEQQEQQRRRSRRSRSRRRSSRSRRNSRAAKEQQNRNQNKKQRWKHPGAPGPRTSKAIRTCIGQAITRQAIWDSFHKLQLTDKLQLQLADPQVAPTSYRFNDFDSEFYAIIAAARHPTTAFTR